MSTNNERIQGGIFHPELPNQRAAAIFYIRLDQGEIVAIVHEDLSFSLSLETARLEIGGATGNMIFLHFADNVTLFTECLEILDELEKTTLKSFVQDIRLQRKRNRRNGVFLWGSLIAGFFLVCVSIFFVIQNIGSYLVSSIPIEVDKKLGDFSSQTISKEGPVLSKDELTKPIQQIVSQLTASIDTDWDFNVHVIDADIQNAYALPGGYIFVYTGLIKDTTRPEQIAGVLAHEIAHVTKRHGLQRIVDTASLGLLVDVLFGNMEGIVVVGLELVKSSAINAYSREDEAEADSEGLKLLVAANLDPNGMVELFQIMMEEDSEVEEMIPLWMRSHPKHEERIQTLQQQIKLLPQSKLEPLDIDWKEYKRKLSEL